MMKQRQSAIRAFTLVELLVSITIFSIFIAVGVASYIHISLALKKADVERRLVTTMEMIMNDIQTIGKFSHIDYEWYVLHHITIDPEGGNSELVLLSKDGLSRTIFALSPSIENILGVYKEQKIDDVFVPLTGFADNNFEAMHSPDVLTQVAQFYIYPSTQQDLDTFQEKVTIVLQAEMKNPFAAENQQLTIQSTYSSRLYEPTYSGL